MVRTILSMLMNDRGIDSDKVSLPSYSGDHQSDRDDMLGAWFAWPEAAGGKSAHGRIQLEDLLPETRVSCLGRSSS